MTRLVVDRYLASRPARAVAAVLFAVGAWLFTFGVPGLQRFVPYRIDLDVYRTGGQVFRDGGDLYGELPRLSGGIHLPFTYPPISAEIFSVFTFVPLPVASTIVTVGTIVCLAFVLVMLLRDVTSRGRAERWWIVVAVLAVGLWFGPVRETLGFGQVNVLLMTLVLVDCLRGRGRWWSGVLVGLATAIKLTPAVFLLYFLLRRDWRSAAMTIVSALAFTGIGHLLAPDDSYRYWTFAIRDPARIGGLAFASNQSINGVVHRLGLEGSAASVAWFVVSCAVGLGIAVVVWRLLRGGHDAAAAVTTGLVALFCSPVSWGHHWVWSVPMITLLLVWAARQGSDQRLWWVLAGTGTLVLLSTPQWWFPHENDTELGWGPVAHIVGDAYLLWALAFLVAVGLRAHRLGGPDRDVDTIRGLLPDPGR